MTNTQKILTALTSWILVVVFIVTLIGARTKKMNETPVEQEVATVETVEEVVEETPVEEVVEEEPVEEEQVVEEEPVEEEPEVVEEQVEEVEEETEEEPESDTREEITQTAMELYRHNYNKSTDSGEITEVNVVNSEKFSTVIVTLKVNSISDSYYPNENPEYEKTADSIAKDVWTWINNHSYEADGGVTVVVGDLTGNTVTIGGYTPQ